MAWIKTGTFYPPITIIGKDLEAVATFNGDIGPNLGLIPAGTFMSYDASAKLLTPWNSAPMVTETNPLGDPEGATIFGILAMGVDASDSTVVAVGMVYRGGTFLRQEIEAANQIVIPEGGVVDLALKNISIFLEYSHEMYVDMETPPPSAPTVLP
jgi:hypothetical protein